MKYQLIPFESTMVALVCNERKKKVKLNPDICQLVWLTKNTSYENVRGIFLRKNTIDS